MTWKKKRSNGARESRNPEETMTGIGIVAVFLMLFVSVSRDENE